MSTDREANVYTAKLAEQAERYEEMVSFMKSVVKEKANLSVEERNLLSVAYKNVVGARRASWRIINSIKGRDEQRGVKEYRTVANSEFKERVDQELTDICQEIIDLITDDLLPASEDDPESKVFYLKMKGDYYRYLAEISEEDKRKTASANSLEAYDKASKEGETLDTTNPIRLGLALNFSVFYYEILGDPTKACDLAKKAFDDAIADLDALSQETYKDTTLIMQLLRDNLTLWTTDQQEDQPEVQDVETTNE